jgi:hypothetical protein
MLGPAAWTAPNQSVEVRAIAEKRLLHAGVNTAILAPTDGRLTTTVKGTVRSVVKRRRLFGLSPSDCRLHNAVKDMDIPSIALLSGKADNHSCSHIWTARP